jgi:esterase/lipase
MLVASNIESGLRPTRRFLVELPFVFLFAPQKSFDMCETWPQSLKESEEGKMWRQDSLTTTRFSCRWLFGTKALRERALQNASQMRKPTLIIQGEADNLDFPSGAKRLLENLAAEDKSLRTFPDADHWFYHAIFPKVTAKCDPKKREEVFSTVNYWLKTK